MIGLLLSIVSAFGVYRFGKLGKLSVKMRSGTPLSPQEMAYVQSQPNWILDNPNLCRLLGNIAPFGLILGLILIFLGIYLPESQSDNSVHVSSQTLKQNKIESQHAFNPQTREIAKLNPETQEWEISGTIDDLEPEEKFSHYAVNSETEERIGYNKFTKKWEPVPKTISVLDKMKVAASKSKLISDENFFSLFNDTCVSKSFDYGAVESTANILKWPKLSDAELKAFLPPDSNKAMGWKAERNEEIYLLVLSWGQIYGDGQEYRVCTLMSVYKDYGSLDHLIQKYIRTSDRKVYDEPDQKIISYYAISQHNEPLVIYLKKSNFESNNVVLLEAISEAK